LEKTFGLPVLRTYGIHEVQTVAVECPARGGLHIFEDAFVAHVVDPDTGARLPDGETGSLVITELYKTGSAQFRYNTMDLTFLHPPGRCECGSWLRRMGPFAGRGDNMVKLRGINVWPEALGDLAMTHAETTNDYFVRAVRDGDRDELVLSIVSESNPDLHARIAGEVAQMLKDRVGVKIGVEVVPPGELDEWTEADRSPKLKRFRDER
jgi:phenylacetate-CoA ligase